MVWLHKFANQKGWIELSAFEADSSDVAHHPFQAGNTTSKSYCNLAERIQSHEFALALNRNNAACKPVCTDNNDSD